MKLHIPTIVLAVALTATGCNSSQKEQTTTESVATVTDPNTQDPSDSVANSLTPVVTEAPAQVPAAQSPSSAVALNPVHGAPGHRCDIEVGQPLNSPPKTGAQPIQQQAPQPAAPQLAPAPQLPAVNNLPANSKLAFNPEHGKPGHRCDIAVGAPLN